MNWSWIADNVGLIGTSLGQHLLLALIPVAASFILSIPIGYLIFRLRAGANVVLAIFGAPVDLPESRVVRLQRLHPGSIVKSQVGAVLVPRPLTAKIGGRPIDGIALLEWAHGVIEAVLDTSPGKTAGTSTTKESS